MPDDTYLVPDNERLGCLDPEELVMPTYLFHSGIEDNEVMDDFQ
jgi:hypothetical protein